MAGRSDATNAVAQAPFGVLSVAFDGRVLDANPALRRILGAHDATPITTLNVRERVIASADDWLAWTRATAEPSEWMEQVWTRLDGLQIHVRVSVSAIAPGDGAVPHLVAFVEDVSERDRRQDQARRSERMSSLGRTLAGLAHEINNPLAAIIGFGQILLKTDQTTANRRALETLLGEAQRAARIVKDLLAISRKREPGSRVSFDLNTIVTYVLSTQRTTLDALGIATDLALAPDGATVEGDPAQWEQVVLNLIINARQSLEARAHLAIGAAYAPALWIRTRMDEAGVGLEVRDNGTGIRPEDLPHIWDPFWTGRPEGQGVGLGLAVVHSIVAGHGGTIDVHSAPTVETRFDIVIPRAPADAPPTEAPGPAASSATRALDVLIVDDEEALRTLLTRMLSERGHAVVTAASGAQALRLAEQSTFDVVLCDLRMPAMDGRDVIRRMGALPSCATTRFVLSTGDIGSVTIQPTDRAIRIDAIIAKPYDLSLLLEIVEGTAAS